MRHGRLRRHQATGPARAGTSDRPPGRPFAAGHEAPADLKGEFPRAAVHTAPQAHSFAQLAPLRSDGAHSVFATRPFALLSERVAETSVVTEKSRSFGASLPEGDVAGAPSSPRGIIQRQNQILSNTYERSESPVTTIKKFVAQQTGKGEAEVLKSMKKGLKEDAVGSYLKDLDSSAADYRPIMTKAYIDGPTGSKPRPTLVTAIGKLGYLEDLLRRGGSVQGYNGGHLLALEFFKDWDGINSARNIAPQEEDENKGWNDKAWRGVERFEKKVSKGKGKNPANPLVITSYVNYPNDQYTVSLRTIADNVLDGAVKAAVDELYFTSFRRVTIDTRLPSQFVTEHTPYRFGPLANEEDDFIKEGKEADSLLTAGVPTRLPRTLFAPVEDLLLRAFDSRSSGANTAWGGAYVQSNQSIYDRSVFRGTAENMARLVVYYYLFACGYPVAVAVHAGLSYFGSSAGEGLVQRCIASLAGKKELPWVSWGTSVLNSLVRYTAGDRLFSLGSSLLNGLVRAVISPTSVPATLLGLLPRSEEEKED